VLGGSGPSGTLDGGVVRSVEVVLVAGGDEVAKDGVGIRRKISPDKGPCNHRRRTLRTDHQP
jgi:hypothetical protein